MKKSSIQFLIGLVALFTLLVTQADFKSEPHGSAVAGNEYKHPVKKINYDSIRYHDELNRIRE